MTQELYEIIALGARYAFAGLMVLIVWRAWRNTLIDSRRARILRRYSPQTGLSGELIVLEGDGQARRGMKYMVTREGLIGNSRLADIRIRNGSIRRRHAWFELTPEGLSIQANAGAAMRDGHNRPARSLILKDGDRLTLGRVRLMLVLSDSTLPPPEDRHKEDVWFETDPDKLFETQPVLNHRRADDEENRHAERPYRY